MNKFFLRRFLLFLLAFSPVYTIADTFPNGENLIQLMPLPEERWTAYEKQSGKAYIRKWIKNEGKDQVFTVIFKGDQNPDLQHSKNIDTKTGEKKCKSFTLSDERNDIENGYTSLTWISTCKLSQEKTITVLQKLIAGNDSSYNLKRVWMTNGHTPDSLSEWKNYMDSIYVCDTRLPDQKCPSGYQTTND